MVGQYDLFGMYRIKYPNTLCLKIRYIETRYLYRFNCRFNYVMFYTHEVVWILFYILLISYCNIIDKEISFTTDYTMNLLIIAFQMIGKNVFDRKINLI